LKKKQFSLVLRDCDREEYFTTFFFDKIERSSCKTFLYIGSKFRISKRLDSYCEFCWFDAEFDRSWFTWIQYFKIC
jgi:hypothetical protein